MCGGFTTFSTFALETTDLIKGGHVGVAFLYAILSMNVGCTVIFATEVFVGK
ncbi:MAG: CrcB family protein [Butyrivibrio sp.]|nr:CrcB family protein [Butyrivibrio sp.]